MRHLRKVKLMSAAENSPSPARSKKDKGSPKARPSSRLRKSSTDRPSDPPPTPPSVVGEASVALPLEVVLNPGHLLKLALDTHSTEAELSTDNPTLAVLQDMVEGMKAGESLEDLRVPLLQLTGNQEERAKLVRSLMLTHDYSRLSNYLILRDKLEQLMLGFAVGGQLSPAEGLSFLRTVREEISTIQGSVTEGATSSGDVTTLLNKVSFAAKAHEDILSKKIKSSPQNRELVRKLIFRLSKLSRASRSSTGK